MTRMETGISPKYVKGWTVEKGIREIVQNYLDSREEFNCEGHIKWEDGIAIAKDYGPGLELRHLALGISEKGGNTIGKYGEGLKLALLVMARENRQIEVWANGNIIVPSIEFSEDYQTDIMVLTVTKMEARHAATHTGTSVKFECTEEELESGKRYFEHYLVREGDFNWMERGKISLPGGHIFINGARVGEVPNAQFSYHLNESETGDIGNRDREVINKEKVQQHVKRIISSTSSTKVMEDILKSLAVQDSTWEVEMGLTEWVMTPGNRKTWKRSYNKVMGKDTVISIGDGDADTQARYRGYQVAQVGWQWQSALQTIGVADSRKAITKENGGARKIALKNLTKEERENFKLACKLVNENYAEIGSISVVEDLDRMAGVSEGTRVDGLYKSSEDRIYVRRGLLSNMQETLHTVLHEAVHKHSGQSDCTSGFERALAMVAVGMMMRK